MERRDAGFFDPQHGLSGADAAAIAAHQAEVAAETGMPIDTGVWERFPPASSHPPSIAVHAAALQGAGFGDRMLRRVQEAFFTERRPVDTPEALIGLAAEVPGLDARRFAGDVLGPAAYAAFRADWEDARRPLPEARDVKETEGRLRYAFPTLVLRGPGGALAVLDGGHPYAAYAEAVAELAPGVTPAPVPAPKDFLARWGTAATREVAEGCALGEAAAEAALQALAAAGAATGRAVGPTTLWRWTGGSADSR